MTYTRQPHLQATTFVECEYDIGGMIERQPESAFNPTFYPDVQALPRAAATADTELTKTLATIYIMKKELETSLLKNKGLESDLRAKNAELDSSKRTIETMTPCYHVGTAICSRKMQKQLAPKDQDQNIIERGDSMAHHGTVMPDFSLFVRERGNNKLKPNEKAFTNMYGVPPGIVREFCSCEKFIQLLNWRGSMKAFKGKIYEKTPFNTKFLSCLAQLKTRLSASPVNARGTKVLNDILTSAELSPDIKFLKKEYEAAKKENQAYHRRRIYQCGG